MTKCHLSTLIIHILLSFYKTLIAYFNCTNHFTGIILKVIQNYSFLLKTQQWKKQTIRTNAVQCLAFELTLKEVNFMINSWLTSESNMPCNLTTNMKIKNQEFQPSLSLCIKRFGNFPIKFCLCLNVMNKLHS